MKRLSNETMIQYSKRRKNSQQLIKAKLKGKVVWNNGTFIKAKEEQRHFSFTQVLRNKKGYDKYLAYTFNQ